MICQKLHEALIRLLGERARKQDIAEIISNTAQYKVGPSTRTDVYFHAENDATTRRS